MAKHDADAPHKSQDRDDDDPTPTTTHGLKPDAPHGRTADTPTADQIRTSIGIDYGGTGDYTYEEVPLPLSPDPHQPRAASKGLEEPPPECRTLHITRQGRDFKHVATDALGRWLYR
jgi:hypothetical protein